MLRFSILLFLLFPTIVFSHGLGNEIRKDVDGFFFEFDTDITSPKTGEKITIGFSFHNSSTDLPIEADNLWIRISKGDKVYFSTNDFAFKKAGPVFFTYLFSEPGNYSIDISTSYDSKELKTSFEVNVQEAPEKYITYGFLIILIVAIIFLKLHKFKKLRQI